MNTCDSSPANHSISRPAVSHVRWWICFLIFLATVLLYSDRQFLSLLKSTLAAEIHWTDSQFAGVNSCFLGAYACGLLFAGRLIDKVGVRTGYAVTLLLWGFAALSHTLVSSVQGFMLARIFLGVSEAGNFPAAIKTVAQWFPSAERAFATTLFNSGANVGAIIAPLLVAWLLTFSTWHAPFIIAGVAGFLWVAFWLFFYRSPEVHPLMSRSELDWIRSDATEEGDNASPIPWIRLARLPQSWSFITAKFLTDPVWFFLLFWLPDYFKKTRHLDIKSSWPHLMTVYALVTVISLCGGYFPGYLLRRGWSVTRARKTALITYATLVVPILAIGTAGDWAAVLLIGLVGGAHQSWSANLFTTVSDMFPRKAIGTLVGLGSMAGALGSMLFQFLCGHILDLYGPEHASAGYFLLFIYAASAYLLAFFINNLLAPSYKPLRLEAS